MFEKVVSYQSRNVIDYSYPFPLSFNIFVGPGIIYTKYEIQGSKLHFKFQGKRK
jgi:hypothetical protein